MISIKDILTSVLASSLFLLFPVHHASAQHVSFCESKVMYAPASEQSGTNGVVLGEFNPQRGDGEACFSTRYFRLLKIYRDVHLEPQANGCGLQDMLAQSGDICDPQYFWHQDCDTDLVSVMNAINSMLAMPQPCVDGYDVYSDPRVFTLNDTLISVEIQRVFVPWEDQFIKPVEKWRLRQCLLQGWCDTTKSVRKEVMLTPMPKVFHDGDNLDPRNTMVLNSCKRCNEYVGQLRHHQNRPQLDGVGHYLAVVFDLRTGVRYSVEQLAGENARAVIYEYVLAFNEEHPELRLNEYHYRPENRRHLIYAVSEDHLVIYTGDEGEFRAYYKILIPWDAFNR